MQQSKAEDFIVQWRGYDVIGYTVPGHDIKMFCIAQICALSQRTPFSDVLKFLRYENVAELIDRNQTDPIVPPIPGGPKQTKVWMTTWTGMQHIGRVYFPDPFEGKLEGTELVEPKCYTYAGSSVWSIKDIAQAYGEWYSDISKKAKKGGCIMVVDKDHLVPIPKEHKHRTMAVVDIEGLHFLTDWVLEKIEKRKKGAPGFPRKISVEDARKRGLYSRKHREEIKSTCKEETPPHTLRPKEEPPLKKKEEKSNAVQEEVDTCVPTSISFDELLARHIADEVDASTSQLHQEIADLREKVRMLSEEVAHLSKDNTETIVTSKAFKDALKKEVREVIRSALLGNI